MSRLGSEPANLEVDGLTVRFGGLVAVDSVSLRSPAGFITGLIGPNGAGKTTTFNACTGVVLTDQGTIRLGDEVLNKRTPAQRSQLGLGRTFQRIALFDTMDVLENVAMGPECQLAGRGWRRQLCGTRRERLQCQAQAEVALERCGIHHLARTAAGNLSTGQRRLVELARAIASRFSFLLLDEPSSGLDNHETELFAQRLVEIALDDGVGILLVEHDMALVREVCEYIYVLDFGKLIFEGPTADALGSELVQAAYLGSVEVG